MAEAGRFDGHFAGAGELVRKVIAHQAAEVHVDELAGDFALPAVGGFR